MPLSGEKLDKAVAFVLKCQNFDGGFGAVPGAESHAGQSALGKHLLTIASFLLCGRLGNCQRCGQD